MKNWTFQLHWFLGITAGIVLGIIGVTGGMMSFERQIMEWMSSDVVYVEVPADGNRLTPDAIVSRFNEHRPDAGVQQLTLSSDPSRAVVVRTRSTPESRRGESLYLNPYSGELLGKIRGEQFFRDVRSLHRWLLIPSGEGINWGRHLTGFSTIALVYLSLSGLYLRWPRRALNWRAWLRLDFRLRGRSLYWSLHSVIGTWVLIVYLLLSFTGLYWSYSWYRTSMSWLLTGEVPEQRRGGGGGARGGFTPPPETGEVPSIDAAWSGFLRYSDGEYRTAFISLPQGDAKAAEVFFVLPDALHNRQSNQVALDLQTGDMVRERPYQQADTLGKRIYQGVYDLHVGDWFGTTGRVVNMVASLAMPLFMITGFLLYFDRRRKKRETRAASAGATQFVSATGEVGYLVVYASQTGTAEQLAWHTASILASGGEGVDVKPLHEVDAALLEKTDKLVLLLSTFGEGEAPDHARSFVKKVMSQHYMLDHLQFAVLGLGDKRYPDYCVFAREVNNWLLGCSAAPFFDALEVDNGSIETLQQWQTAIADVCGAEHVEAWQAPDYDQWPLLDNTHLNPGSAGDPVYRVRFAIPQEQRITWQAGDILDIKPRHNPAVIAELIAHWQLDAAATVEGVSLANWLQQKQLPAEKPAGDVSQWALPDLPHREYSIASLPASGVLELVVRLAYLPDGKPGLGSGWLTQYLQPGELLTARVRTNPAFHAPETVAPMLLVGAGTGIAGLRSHLHHRRDNSINETWLIFGERNRQFDAIYDDELQALKTAGVLSRLDQVFSRDGDGYVQQRLLQESAAVQEMIARGASIYVCGSLTGMGEGIHQVLIEILGEETVQQLTEQKRYCRDVY
ncbi:PepSY domain-containing protein [Cellvibrio polysaccharolyticus]|uniref:PepSY domain-containing protein n=1 Tax=Cellvibrio polysaccharolyticus TaxID=2082724 RepID=UPI001882EDE2|nr:sulfite reductase flavoprotein subunit alpha [Cellvibrio polysaccharolyticus]